MLWMSLRNHYPKTHTALAFLVLSSLLVSSYLYCCRDTHEMASTVAGIETAPAISHECCTLVADFDLALKTAHAPCHCLHDADQAALQSAATWSTEALSALAMQDFSTRTALSPWMNAPALELGGPDLSAFSVRSSSSSASLGGLNAQPVFLRTLRLLV